MLTMNYLLKCDLTKIKYNNYKWSEVSKLYIIKDNLN